jgi:hypothetical protein
MISPRENDHWDETRIGIENGENEVGHVGIAETRFLTLWTDDLWARAFLRVRGCISPRVDLRATSLLCRWGSRLALLVSGEVPKGPYPTLVIRQSA